MKLMQSFLPVLMAFALTGCGSFLGRMSQRDKPYPGVRFTTDELTSQKKLGPEQILWLDLPISLAMDTLLLPIDLLQATSKHDDVEIGTPHSSPRR